ncbi:MAG TPA: hypothetical protein VHS74_12405 [Solirubrobacterales bacterium]|jgi:phosphoserine phosphatase|nr:hypothetical protein [Solirubrobacterales bacterium]
MNLEPDSSGEFTGIARPSATAWKLKEQERELFLGAEEVPNWRLADKTRRLVLDMGYFLSEIVSRYAGAEVDELETRAAHQIAALSLSTLMVRSAGSGLTLISGGYVPESAASIRRCVEANLRIASVLEDETGGQARAWLKGRPLGSVGRLAGRHGKAEDLKLLSIYAHSDVRGLAPLLTGPPEAKEHIDLRPNRDDPSAAPLLHAIAYECAFMCINLGIAFDLRVELPSWVHGELKRLKEVTAELNARYKPDREAARRP